LEKRTQRRVFQYLKLVVKRRFSVIFSVGDIVKEGIDFLVWNDVTDVLRVDQAAKPKFPVFWTG